MTSVKAVSALFEEFWKSEHITSVRRWIDSEEEYANILKPVLESINRTITNNLSATENEMLNKLEIFLVVLRGGFQNSRASLPATRNM